ncbi:MAG: response regulator transcription factor [Pseudomonadota bacterium]
MPPSILVIEDHHDIAELVALHLRDEGCEVTVHNDGSEGLAAAHARPYDLLVLDLMLPGTDGLTICRELRTESHYLPILMLTAKSTELDRVLGLEMGADDYLTKPFSIRELVARVKALLRRAEAMGGNAQEQDKVGSDSAEKLQCGELLIDTGRRQVSIGDKTIELTAKEFDLLLHFARHPGRVYSRIQLLDQVWGYGHEGYEHTVNSHINRLRSKIEVDQAKPRYVLTVWGVGYKFNESP